MDVDKLVETAKADFRADKKRSPIVTDYIKPEYPMTYYVINEKFEGKFLSKQHGEVGSAMLRHCGAL